MGFNISKTPADVLFLHVKAVFSEIGKIYPDFGCMEIFEAFDFCLVHKPEICKSYDRAEGASSFTSVYLATIIKYFLDNRADFYAEISQLMREINEKETIQQENMRKIKYYRDAAQCIIHNVFCVQEIDEFVNDSTQYIANLYELMKLFLRKNDRNKFLKKIIHTLSTESYHHTNWHSFTELEV